MWWNQNRIQKEEKPKLIMKKKLIHPLKSHPAHDLGIKGYERKSG